MQKHLNDLYLQDFSDASDTSTVYSDLQTLNRNIDQRTMSISSTCSSSSSLDLDRTQSTDSREDRKQQNNTPKRREREKSLNQKRRKTPTPTKFLQFIEDNTQTAKEKNKDSSNITKNLKKTFTKSRK